MEPGASVHPALPVPRLGPGGGLDRPTSAAPTGPATVAAVRSAVSAPVRRRRGAVVALVAGVALLAGCAGQRIPTSYTSGVEKDFVQGCTETYAGSESIDAGDYCQCIYDAVSGDDGLKFSEFRSINDDLTEDPGPLPAKLSKFADACEKQAG